MNVTYTVYADSIFVIGFGITFMVLYLADIHFFLLVPKWKITMASILSGLISVLPFFAPGKFWIKNIGFNGIGMLFVLLFTFRMKTVQSVFLVLLYVLKVLFLFGGAIGLLMKITILVFGTVKLELNIAIGCVCVFGLCLWWEKKCRKRMFMCKAILRQGTKKVTVEALIDSGNSLVEPISKKPVCIVERSLYDFLFQGQTNGFRVIPYHSIGKTKGILPGYLLSDLWIKRGGPDIHRKDIYVAICDEQIRSCKESGVKMILNPQIFYE